MAHEIVPSRAASGAGRGTPHRANRYDAVSAYVPALPDEGPGEIVVAGIQSEPLVPVQLPTLPQPVSLQTTYTDRSRGFALATAPLAAAVGCMAALVGVLGFAVPIASLMTLLLALAGFCATWLLAYVAHIVISPDGALFAHVLLAWRYLRVEQRERHRRYRRVR